MRGRGLLFTFIQLSDFIYSIILINFESCKHSLKMKTFRLIFPAAFMLATVSCVNVPQEQHTSFETITLAPKNVTIPNRWSTSIAGRKDVTIIPQTEGQLTRVCVVEGERVKKGQVLFEIDSRQSKIDLSTAKSDLLAAEAQMNSAELEYNSNQNLYAKSIISEYMLKKSHNDLLLAQAAVAQARSAVSAAELRLSYCTIKSPVDGIIGSLPYNPGDLVSTVTPLTTVAGSSEMSAKFSLTETQIEELTKEYGPIEKVISLLPPVTLILKDGTEYTHKGKVNSVSGVVDNATGSVTCTAIFPNPDGFLYSGIQGNVSMDFDYENVIVVPLTAIVRLQDKSLVYRVKNNCAESVIIEIEDLGNGKDAIVIGGIETGEVIVAKGAGNVYEGQQVIFPEESSEKE